MQEQNGDPQQSGRSSENRSQLNHLKRLLADRHYRDTQQRFVVEGILVHIQNMATASSDYSDRRLPVCLSAETSYSTAEFPRPNVVMLGQERQGLSSRQRQHCNSLVRIPMSSDSDSLNLAVAGSLLLYRAAET